jgi:hypothetical protein
VNAEDLRELAQRAMGVEGRPATRLAEVHSRIRWARRRRQAGAVAATVVAVVLALTAGSAVVKLTDADPPPVTPPSPSPKPKVDKNASAVRQLVWARGSTIHVGDDQTVDGGDEVVGIAATDDGAVFTTRRGSGPCNPATSGCFGALWFTDGSQPVRIGRAYGSLVRGYQVTTSAVGSTVVYLEPSNEEPDDTGIGHGEYVVYDTAARGEVARFGSADSVVEAVYDDVVYWSPSQPQRPRCLDFSTSYAQCRRHDRVMRLDVATGRQSQVPWSAYDSDRRSRPMVFVYRAPSGSGLSGVRYVDHLDFGHEGDRLVGDDMDVGVVTARLARSGAPVRLRLPAGYPDPEGREGFRFVMWLDDSRIALAADFPDDFLSCRLPDGRCRVIASGPMDYGFGGRG